MSAGLIFPEFAVRDAVDSALAAILPNAALLDALLATRPASERDSLRTALAYRPGKVRLGWGLETLEDWQVTVILSSTHDPRHVLGDGPSGTMQSLVAQRDLATDIDATEEQTLALDGSFPSTIATRGLVQIEDETAIYRVEGGATIILEHRNILGSVAVAHVAGTTASFLALEHDIGWPEMLQIRVDVCGTNAQFVMQLGRIVKAALLANRLQFESQGMTLQSINETDLAPQPAALPANIYVRTLMVTCQSEFRVPEPLDIVTATELQLATEGTAIAYDPQLTLHA